MRHLKRIVFLVSIISLASCTGEPQKQSVQPAQAAVQCEDGSSALMDVVAVTGTHELRKSPNSDAEKAKNERSSEIFNEEHFHQINGSTTVRRLCMQDEWTEVQIEEPKWLNHVKGWVPNSALREIEKDENGKRIYVEEDFYWEKETSPYKQQIVAVVNKISREKSDCKTIDTGTVTKSASRSKPRDPVFFVTCNSGNTPFNVWFRPTDVEKGVSFAN